MKKTTFVAIALFFLLVIILNVIYNKNITSSFIVGILAGIGLGKSLAEII